MEQGRQRWLIGHVPARRGFDVGMREALGALRFHLQVWSSEHL